MVILAKLRSYRERAGIDIKKGKRRRRNKAAIEAVWRNGELEEWRQSGKLPSWESKIEKAA